VRLEEVAGNAEATRVLDDERPIRMPTVIMTPWGPAEGAFPHLSSRFEPAWPAARDAARHARQAADDRLGHHAATLEAAWQADQLASILE
jgi:hypothetical protein